MNKTQQKLRQSRAAAFDDFYAFHKAHPDMRFWQALYAWSGFTHILVANAELNDFIDPFPLEGKNLESET